ncbi:PaeR7I family type II restriction endonuclease [Vibrio cyclitrophicus]|uniref:PaeR7I family type II restriction endonuclease n=1 Tax=Vibrio TaxID=662 RepID=UPI000C85907B|nr:MULTISPECIES: PaeR7I family type II restriction endonuclease [Vibrio]PMG33343.1 hypothetical protein BCU92_05725 [Vibrio cyclitrophicus]ROR62984.1 restriction endonuclease XhoI [Vibrio crassostreae]
MAEIVGYKEKVEDAVESFWHVRKTKGVRSGQTLDKFEGLLKWVVQTNGLPNAKFVTGSGATVPGFFRVTKNWDFLVFDGDTLIAAIEMKSIADSPETGSNNFGKNSNNRAEEATGSGVDIKEAYAEDAFEGLVKLFTGYIILVEDCPLANSSVRVSMKHFRVMTEFMQDPTLRDITYVKKKDGTFPSVDTLSPIRRFDLLCKRMMQKQLYTAASVVLSQRDTNHYSDVSQLTSIKSFVASFAGYIQGVAAAKS